MSRVFCAIHPLYDKTEADARHFADHHADRFRHREAGRDEVRLARLERREVPGYVLVFPLDRWDLGAGTVRLGWRWPAPPSLDELSAYEFEPGTKIAAILKGAARAVRAELRRGQAAWRLR